MPAGSLRRKLWRTTRRRGYTRAQAVAYVQSALAELAAQAGKRVEA